MASGNKIMYTVMASTHGLTVNATREISRTIKSTGMESIPGPTADHMMVYGKKEKCTEKEPIFRQKGADGR